ncbi:hypothetical protein [Methanobrevibacter sp. UBA212]|nr:hypothetical protein [Methanobrevibacter sp. UBA212]
MLILKIPLHMICSINDCSIGSENNDISYVEAELVADDNTIIAQDDADIK